MSTVLSEQEQLRRQAMQSLLDMGIDPFPANEFVVNAHAADILENYDRDKLNYKNITIAGRIMSRRVMGSASFFEIQDSTGRIQAYIKRDDVCPDENKDLYNVVFKKLLDIGDIVGIKGYVFTTQTEAIAVHVEEFTVLSKSLRPLPVVKSAEGKTFDAFTDPEQRYRMRYVDLIVNPSNKDIFIKRTKLFNAMRQFFNDAGYMEVETPVLQSIPGGAAARPFITHHNALDIPLYLRVSRALFKKTNGWWY